MTDYLKSKNNDTLKAVADNFGVDLNDKTKKAEYVEALIADGVTDDMVRDFLGETAPKPETKDAPPVTSGKEAEEKAQDNPEDQVILRMTRANPTYQTHGYTFHAKYPFTLVPKDVAESILRVETGFSVALSSEVEDFHSR